MFDPFTFDLVESKLQSFNIGSSCHVSRKTRKRGVRRTIGQVWREHFPEIFVGNIDKKCMETELMEVLSPFGKFMEVYIPRR